MFSVSNSSFNVVAKSTNIGGEGRPGYAGRKIVVEPGQIYVFMTGVMDQQGMHETYRGGEIVYVSDTADMQSRKFVALNERAAELTIHGERDLLGISTASDKASITVRLTLTVRDPLKLATLYASTQSADNELRVKVEGVVLHYIENTLAIWSQPEHELVNIIATRINNMVEGYGLGLSHANTLIMRTMPKTLAALQAEARMADLRLLEAVDTNVNGTPTEALREFDRNLSGIIFTEQRITEWLAGAHVSSRPTHGKAFVQLIANTLAHETVSTIDPDDEAALTAQQPEELLNTFLLDRFKAVALSKYVKALRGTALQKPEQVLIDESLEVLLNSFA